MWVSSISGSGPRLAARTFSKITRSRFGSYIGREVVRFNLPIACAASARSLNSETICRSSSSIFLRQSSISMQSPYAARVRPRLLFQCNIRTVELTGLQNGRSRARPQTLDKSRDRAGRVLWSGPLNVLLDDAHQRAADYGCVSELAHSGKMLRIRNAEAHSNGQMRISAQARDEAFGLCGQRLLRPSGAGARDGVDKSPRGRGDSLQPLVGTGGRGKKNRRKMMAFQMRKVFTGFFDNHVCHQHAIHTRLLCCSTEALYSKAQNGIEIGKDDQARFGPLPAQIGSNSEHIAERRAVLQRSLAGALDDRPVGQRIAEGHAQLDHIRTGVNGGQSNLSCRCQVGIASSEVGHQPGSRFRFGGKTNRHLNDLRSLETHFAGEDSYVLVAAS